MPLFAASPRLGRAPSGPAPDCRAEPGWGPGWCTEKVVAGAWFVEGFGTLAGIGPAVSVFGSARTPEASPEYALAREVGARLAEAGFTVITGGGPGNSTTFVSIELVKIALGQFDLGKAAALSLVYNLIILIVCWVFYTVMTNMDRAASDIPEEL